MPQPVSLRATSRTWSVQTWWPSPREPQWIITVTMPRSSPSARAAVLVVDLVHLLHLEEVVARAQRAELVAAAVLRGLAHRARVGVGQHAGLLAVLEVARGAQAAPDRPARPVAQHPVQIARA